MNIVILEDEMAAFNRLLPILSKAVPDLHIQASFSTVAEASRYFQHTPVQPDLILSDIQLADGLSFSVFANNQIQVPVIFITAFDHYMMEAFDHFGIDYLLKPVEETELVKAITKYRQLSKHFKQQAGIYSQLYQYTSNPPVHNRLMVKKGLDTISLKIDEVVMIYTANRIVYAIDVNQHKYIISKTLGELETALPPNRFFRVNRQYIVNIDYIRGYRVYERVKLLLDLTVSINGHTILVSQENAPAFREWMERM